MSHDHMIGVSRTYRELMTILQGLCREKRSGVMVITSDAGGFAKITLEIGEIFAATCKDASGEAALPLLKAIRQGAPFFYKVTPGNGVRQIKRSTLEILHFLDESAPAFQSAADRLTAPPPIV